MFRLCYSEQNKGIERGAKAVATAVGGSPWG